ncbi:hypothetical protein PoB_000766200 [Plakobranchus ocellatus]|uniref:Uncharacterized protein n=1 Tax=Plakobranchus ocellatus TaxID=259542 RepID=A0AAV3YG21_9GAST|nr:hypothetical protein PoB_000766200 [Plakobranchus ocellatus]
MSNRVSPEPDLQMTDQSRPARDAAHLFQLQTQQQQQQPQNQEHDTYYNESDVVVDENLITEQSEQDEYLRAVTPADTLTHDDPVVTLPEEATHFDAESEERLKSEETRAANSSYNQGQQLAENDPPPTVVQGRLPPLPPRSHPAADESGTESAGEPGSEQASKHPDLDQLNEQTSAEAVTVFRSNQDYPGPGIQQQQQQLEEQQDSQQLTTLRERQMYQGDMATTNSRPNSAKRESEVIGGE